MIFGYARVSTKTQARDGNSLEGQTQALKDAGAEGVILGCTEIGMLVEQKDACLPVYDTTLLHARMAAAFALEEEK